MQNLPLIGIPGVYRTHKQRRPDYGVSTTYTNAILAAGGLPAILPTNIAAENWPALVGKMDGFMFVGGGDIEPRRYGAPEAPDSYGFSTERDDFELGFLPLVLAADKPLLAICRGLQVLNVGLGGTLIGDIPSQCPQAQKHDQFTSPRDTLAHSVSVQPGSLLARALGSTELKTNSLHHQSILQPAGSLVVNAQAPDGILEGVELPGKRFVLGVQWHPEELFTSQEAMLNIFRAFIAACRA